MLPDRREPGKPRTLRRLHMSTQVQKQLTAAALVFCPTVVSVALDPTRMTQALVVGAVSSAIAFFVSGQLDTRPLTQLRTAIRRAAQGREYERPGADAPPQLLEIYDELDELISTRSEKSEATAEDSEVLRTKVRSLRATLDRELESSRDITSIIQRAEEGLNQVSLTLNKLQETAGSSHADISHMSMLHEQVSASIGELSLSVRETLSSIEEMTFSIREVATNIDALSLTAEETSSSMNQMDVSIDQVQSNANETARLSENVAQDAELGAEAILKTMGEIYRIKESSQEALGVINNLGSRIEAIGEILNVIDDVAEQTNLLALNAAIIAAQAGEHGKGFAVVAEEIKDLADRSGASTKEIADLIKTIQHESRNAIAAVEQGAENVDRGVEVSNEAERALKKILESSKKSTNMVRAIARATVEQAKGSKQVTDAISRIAETVQQIAAATAQQARGSELIMKGGERMRSIAQEVELSTQEQARGSQRLASSIAMIHDLTGELVQHQRVYSESSGTALTMVEGFVGRIKEQTATLKDIP